MPSSFSVNLEYGEDLFQVQREYLYSTSPFLFKTSFIVTLSVSLWEDNIDIAYLPFSFATRGLSLYLNNPINSFHYRQGGKINHTSSFKMEAKLGRLNPRGSPTLMKNIVFNSLNS